MEVENEVESIVDDYLDDMQIARRKVCERIAEIVAQDPESKDEALFLLARGAGSDLALDTAKDLRRCLAKMEVAEARADIYRKYEEVVKDE